MQPITELSPASNTGLLVAPPTSTDYIAGAESPLGTLGNRVLNETGDWRPYLPTEEIQRRYGQLETMNCTAYGYTNVVEAQLNYMRKHNLLSVQANRFLEEKGYLDQWGLVNFSDRALGSMAGTNYTGNYLGSVANTARKLGLVPESVWPWTTERTYDDYYAPVTPGVRQLAREFLNYFDLAYEWVDGGSVTEALKVCPLYVALNTCPTWSTGNVKWCGIGGTNHAVAEIAPNVIYDSYNPYTKTLGEGYSVPYRLKVIINQKEQPVTFSAIQKRGDQTVYLLSGTAAFPFSSLEAFVHAGGNQGKIVVLDEAEFYKYDIRQQSPIIKL